MKISLIAVLALVATPAFSHQVIGVPATVIDVTPHISRQSCDVTTGVVIVALIGSQFGKGNGRVAGAVIGSVIGAETQETKCRNRPAIDGYEVIYQIGGGYYTTILNWEPMIGSQIQVPMEVAH